MAKGLRKISLKHILSGLVFVLAVGYFVFQARFVVFGSQVRIITPAEGASIPSSLIAVEGWATNVAWVSLNDRQIFTNEDGFWSEKLFVPPGESVITVKTRDRFGRQVEKSVHIMAN